MPSVVVACADGRHGRAERGVAAEPVWSASADRPAASGPGIVAISLREVRKDDIALKYVVKSKIYPEDPDSMFLTLRGGGISVYDVSNPRNPVLRSRWNSPDDVEGQDRLGDLLVVVARAGRLLTFDVSGLPVMRMLGDLKLKTDSGLFQSLRGGILAELGAGPFDALHVKIYQPGAGRTFAMVSAPNTRELIAVDITDPSRPVQVGAVDTRVQFIEGIYVKDHHAFVGGFGNSGVFTAINIADPRDMKIAKSLFDVAFRQMVSEMTPSHPNVLFAALWNDPGGLGAFDISRAGDFTVIDTLLRPEFSRANRVKVLEDYAFIPLEHEPGGFGVIDVARPDDLKFVALVRGIRDVTSPYTLELKGDYVYVFGSRENSMAILEIQKGPPESTVCLWNFSAETDIKALHTGLPADAESGWLAFLDGNRAGPGSTHAMVTATTRDGIGCLQISPGPGSWSRTNGFVLRHGIDRHFCGTMPRHTIVWDMYLPAQSFDSADCSPTSLAGCRDIALFQLDRRNQQDAGLFLKLGASSRGPNGLIGKSGNPITGGGLNGFVRAVTPDRWHRIAMVVDLTQVSDQVRLYIDGTCVRTVDRVDYERYASIAEGDPEATGLIVDDPNGFLLFADNDGEVNATFCLGGIMFSDRAFTDAEIRALGEPTERGISAEPHRRDR